MKRLCALLVGVGAVCMVSCMDANKQSSSHDNLVDITTINPHIQVRLYFSTPDNFTGKIFYNQYARAYMLRSAAEALSRVQEELEEIGIGLVVLDAYRPVSIQKALWECCPDPDYVINPAVKICRHNNGLGVDVMLVDLRDGSLLPMPCQFFDCPCERDYKVMPSVRAKRNCKLLELIMEKHGFIGLWTEWWHFDYKSRVRSDALDISFEELAVR